MQPGSYNLETGKQEVIFDNPHETVVAKLAYRYRGLDLNVKKFEDGSSESVTTDLNIDPATYTIAALGTLARFAGDKTTVHIASSMIEDYWQNSTDLSA